MRCLYGGDSILRTLYKKLNSLYQQLDFKDSKLRFSQLLSVEDPILVPVLASAAL